MRDYTLYTAKKLNKNPRAHVCVSTAEKNVIIAKGLHYLALFSRIPGVNSLMDTYRNTLFPRLYTCPHFYNILKGKSSRLKKL